MPLSYFVLICTGSVLLFFFSFLLSRWVELINICTVSEEKDVESLDLFPLFSFILNINLKSIQTGYQNVEFTSSFKGVRVLIMWIVSGSEFCFIGLEICFHMERFIFSIWFIYFCCSSILHSCVNQADGILVTRKPVWAINVFTVWHWSCLHLWCVHRPTKASGATANAGNRNLWSHAFKCYTELYQCHVTAANVEQRHLFTHIKVRLDSTSYFLSQQCVFQQATDISLWSNRELIVKK